MTSSPVFELQLEPFTFRGVSRAGVGTCITIPDLSLSLDVAQGLEFAFPMHNFLITHAHQDHAAGIPYIISQKALNKQLPAKFYMPPVMVEPMTEIIRLWQKLEGFQYEFNFIPVVDGQEYPLKGSHFFRCFPTLHRVPSFGYTVFRRTHKLKDEYLGFSREQILDLKSRGLNIHRDIEEPMVSFTGDTQIEFLDRSSVVKQSKILFLEVTYFDQKKTVGEARQWGHIHLDEVIPRLKELACEKLVFMHLSRRYSYRDAQKILQEKLPAHELDRVVLFPV